MAPSQRVTTCPSSESEAGGVASGSLGGERGREGGNSQLNPPGGLPRTSCWQGQEFRNCILPGFVVPLHVQMQALS